MTGLREWNAKDISDRTFSDFMDFTRGQYRDLQAIGGISVHNSSLNLIQKLMKYQEQVSNTLKGSDGIFDTI